MIPSTVYLPAVRGKRSEDPAPFAAPSPTRVALAPGGGEESQPTATASRGTSSVSNDGKQQGNRRVGIWFPFGWSGWQAIVHCKGSMPDQPTGWRIGKEAAVGEEAVGLRQV